MSEPKTKKLSRRDAIKVLGAAAGASVLANIPAKWSKPSVAGGVLPAHAQTSNCPPQTASMYVEFLNITGTGIDSEYSGSAIESGVLDTTGYTILISCTDQCFYFEFIVDDATTASIRVTVNGVVVANWVNISNENHVVNVNGFSGQVGVDEPIICFD